MSIAVKTRFVGIDVGKHDLVIAADGEAATLSFDNTDDGIAAVTGLLLRRDQPVQVAVEGEAWGGSVRWTDPSPNGGYEWPLWEALDAAGIVVRQVPPAQVRAFAKSRGAGAKTDRIDAQLLAAFSAFRPEAGRSLSCKSLRDLRALVTARRQRVREKTRLRGQTDRMAPAHIRVLDQALVDVVSAQIAELDRRIAAAIAADPKLRRAERLLRSIPGVGPVLAATLLAEMPELGALSGKAAAALTGLAPLARDSGTWKGMRFIGGGRKTVRDVLFMAATVAARRNPDLAAFFDKLRSRGLPHKKAVIAVARKLIVLANAIIKRGTPWQRIAA